MRGVFNSAYACIYEIPFEIKCAEEGVVKSAIADEGLYGQGFEVIGECCDRAGAFVRIRTDYGYEGYVKCNDVILCDDCARGCDEGNIQDIQGTKYESVQVKKAVVDILSEPFVASVRLMSVTRGAQLMCLDIEKEKKDEKEKCPDNQYVRVRLYDGRCGYIPGSCVEEYAAPLDEEQIARLDEDKLRESLVRTAASYLGVQYRWGGKTPLGIDCSGLTSMAYMLNGIYIYRDAVLKPGFPVRQIPYECMKPGDLMYFPGHIAMYIGNGDYIHSTARAGSDGVVINSLNPCSTLFRLDLAESLYAVGSVFT